ncbi:MAG TPA: hypothetical protein VFZ17_11025 [Acidimicrobiia bacterium]|nr:hypothetical protein [Acidimicrobiia bacterium]
MTSSASQPQSPRPEPDELDGVARDASTISDVLGAFDAAGYGTQFMVRADAVLRCAACRADFSGSAARVDALRRLEGASDPDDMLVIAALVCPHCAAHGTVVLGYGPAASVEDATALIELEPAPPPEPGNIEQPADD